MRAQPFKDILSQCLRKGYELGGVRFCHDTCHVILGFVPLDAADFQVIGVVFAALAEDERQCRDGAVVLKILLGAVAGGMK